MLETLQQLQAQDRSATRAERAVLARWSGWGAVPHALEPGRSSPYVTLEQQDRIAELLTPEQFADARRNTLNAHYTDAGIVDAVWTAVRALDPRGLVDGMVLEPGCGSGNFLAASPPSLVMVGIELDPVTAAICRYLHPDAEVRTESFGTTRIPEETFDAAVGNVPFGNYSVKDPDYNPGLDRSIHNHFIIKSLALTRPGGVVALVTSRYTLDAENARDREAMAALGDLLGAIRLPENAHLRTAGTRVVTDLLIFRRRDPSAPPADDQKWLRAGRRVVDGTELVVNDYFAAHPEHVLGRLAAGTGQFGRAELGVKDVAGDAGAAGLVTALNQIVRDSSAPAATSGADSPSARPHSVQDAPGLAERLQAVRALDQTRPEGHIALVDDCWTQVENGRVVDLAVPATQAAELASLVLLRDLAHALLDAESQPAGAGPGTDQIDQLRVDLNQAYDEQVAIFGPINRFSTSTTRRVDGTTTATRRTPGQGGFRRDPSSALVYALERFDEETGHAAKASIFTERVVAPRVPRDRVDTPTEALAVVLDTHGIVDLAEVALLLDLPDAAAARAVLGTLVFEDPAEATLVPADEYLCGDVRRKLEVARQAVAEDTMQGDETSRFAANVAALEQVLPRDLLPGEIDGRLGSAWIGKDDVQTFLREITGDPTLTVENPFGAVWTVSGGEYGTAATTIWGTSLIPAGPLAERLLTQRLVEVRREVSGTDGVSRTVLDVDETELAQAKVSEMQERFGEWLWEDTERAARLARVYNDRFNSLVPRTRPTTPRALPGLVASFRPHPHQYAAVHGVVSEPTMLLDHVVGAGKTAEMVIGAMELRRLGLVRKPAIVVPNHMLEQFSREFLQLYPAARILAASTRDLARDNRRRFVARAATGDWDAVILTQRAFESIPMSNDAQSAYLDAELSRLQEAIHSDRVGDEVTLKQLQKMLMNRTAAIEKRLGSTDDAEVTFERTGIDYLFVDEAHHYKNRFTPSATRGQGIDGSHRATDLDMKLHYLRSRAGRRQRVATFATGTPIANSVAEQFVMTSYLRPDLLAAAGIEDYDAWKGTFAETVTDVEVSSDGQSFSSKSRLAKFRNVPELLRIWTAFCDTKVADDLPYLSRPTLVGGRPEMVEVRPTPAQSAVIAILQRAMETAKGGQFLSLFGDGRRTAQDLRLVDVARLLARSELSPGHPAAITLTDDEWSLLEQYRPGAGEDGDKIPAAAGRIAALYDENRDRRYLDPVTGEEHPVPGALQIVFMDQGTPSDGPRSHWDAYAELKTRLVELGVPGPTIRFIHEAANDQQKAELFKAAREGKVSVLIGSTEKMGVGTNVQARAVALHHLDIPWRPADVEQREGRLVRQGNQNPEVRILRYVTQQSFDSYSWQTIERKARFIAQLKKGQLSNREIDDIGASVDLGSFAEAKAVASGNPYLIQKATTDAALTRLERLRRGHERNRAALQQRRIAAEESLAGGEHRIGVLEEACRRAVDISGDRFRISLDGNQYTSRKEAGPALRSRLLEMLGNVPVGTSRPVELGSIAGFVYSARTAHLGGTAPTVQVEIPDVLYGEDRPVLCLARDDLARTTDRVLLGHLERAVRSVERQLDQATRRAAADRDTITATTAEHARDFKYADDLRAARTRSEALDRLFAAQSLDEGHEDRDGRVAAAKADLARLDAVEGIDTAQPAQIEAFPFPTPVKTTPAAGSVPDPPAGGSALTPAEQTRVRDLVTAEASRYGQIGDAARYLAEGPLKDLTDVHGLGVVQEFAQAILDEDPSVLTRPIRTEAEQAAEVKAGTDRTHELSRAAAAAVQAGDLDEALRLLDEIEQINPSYRPRADLTIDDVRQLVEGLRVVPLPEPSLPTGHDRPGRPLSGGLLDELPVDERGSTHLTDAERLNLWGDDARARPKPPRVAAAGAAHIVDERERRSAERLWGQEHPFAQFDANARFVLDRIDDEQVRRQVEPVLDRYRARLAEIGAEATTSYLRQIDRPVDPEAAKRAYYDNDGIQSGEQFGRVLEEAFEDAVREAQDAVRAVGGDLDVGRHAVEDTAGWDGAVVLRAGSRNHVVPYLPDSSRTVGGAMSAAFDRLQERLGDQIVGPDGRTHLERQAHLRTLLADRPADSPHPEAETTDLPNVGVVTDAAAVPLAGTDLAAAEPTAELIAGWTRVDLDALSDDEIAVLLGAASDDQAAIDALFGYIDAREAHDRSHPSPDGPVASTEPDPAATEANLAGPGVDLASSAVDQATQPSHASPSSTGEQMPPHATDTPAPSGPAQLAVAAPPIDLVIEHSQTGTLLFGTRRTDTEVQAVLRHGGWKWSNKIAPELGQGGAWYLQRSWRYPTRDARVRQLTAALDRQGRGYRHVDSPAWRAVTADPPAAEPTPAAASAGAEHAPPDSPAPEAEPAPLVDLTSEVETALTAAEPAPSALLTPLGDPPPVPGSAASVEPARQMELVPTGPEMELVPAGPASVPESTPPVESAPPAEPTRQASRNPSAPPSSGSAPHLALPHAAESTLEPRLPATVQALEGGVDRLRADVERVGKALDLALTQASQSRSDAAQLTVAEAAWQLLDAVLAASRRQLDRVSKALPEWQQIDDTWERAGKLLDQVRVAASGAGPGPRLGQLVRSFVTGVLAEISKLARRAVERVQDSSLLGRRDRAVLAAVAETTGATAERLGDHSDIRASFAELKAWLAQPVAAPDQTLAALTPPAVPTPTVPDASQTSPAQIPQTSAGQTRPAQRHARTDDPDPVVSRWASQLQGMADLPADNADEKQQLRRLAYTVERLDRAGGDVQAALEGARSDLPPGRAAEALRHRIHAAHPESRPIRAGTEHGSSAARPAPHRPPVQVRAVAQRR